MQINPIGLNQYQHQHQNNNIHKTRYEENKKNLNQLLPAFHFAAQESFKTIDEIARGLNILKNKIQNFNPATLDNGVFEDEIKTLAKTDRRAAIFAFQAALFLHPERQQHIQDIKNRLSEYGRQLGYRADEFGIGYNVLLSNGNDSFRCNFFLYFRQQEQTNQKDMLLNQINEYLNWIYDQGNKFYNAVTILINPAIDLLENNIIDQETKRILTLLQRKQADQRPNCISNMRDDGMVLEGNITYDFTSNIFGL